MKQIIVYKDSRRKNQYFICEKNDLTNAISKIYADEGVIKTVFDEDAIFDLLKSKETLRSLYLTEEFVASIIEEYGVKQKTVNVPQVINFSIKTAHTKLIAKWQGLKHIAFHGYRDLTIEHEGNDEIVKSLMALPYVEQVVKGNKCIEVKFIEGYSYDKLADGIGIYEHPEVLTIK